MNFPKLGCASSNRASSFEFNLHKFSRAKHGKMFQALCASAQLVKFA